MNAVLSSQTKRWLLIKHRDQYARRGGSEKILASKSAPQATRSIFKKS